MQDLLCRTSSTQTQQGQCRAASHQTRSGLQMGALMSVTTKVRCSLE